MYIVYKMRFNEVSRDGINRTDEREGERKGAPRLRPNGSIREGVKEDTDECESTLIRILRRQRHSGRAGQGLTVYHAGEMRSYEDARRALSLRHPR